jgi:hypothetical protein
VDFIQWIFFFGWTHNLRRKVNCCILPTGMSFFVIHSFHSRLSPWRASSRGSGGGRSDRASPPLSALYFSFLFEFSLVIKLHAPKIYSHACMRTWVPHMHADVGSTHCQTPTPFRPPLIMYSEPEARSAHFHTTHGRTQARTFTNACMPRIQYTAHTRHTARSALTAGCDARRHV